MWKSVLSPPPTWVSRTKLRSSGLVAPPSCLPSDGFLWAPSFAQEHPITSSLALAGKWTLRSGGGITCRPQLSQLYLLSADLGLVLLPGSYCIIQTQLLAGGPPGRNRPPFLPPPLSLPAQRFLPNTRFPENNLAHPFPELQERDPPRRLHLGGLTASQRGCWLAF